MTKTFSIKYINIKTKQHVQTLQVQRDNEKEARTQADSIMRMYRHSLNELAVTVELVE